MKNKKSYSKKYFGTDGIRGRANSKKMNAALALKIGMASAKLFTKGKQKHFALIGKDTRLSNYTIEPALTSGFLSMGMNVYLTGPLPTPGVASLVSSMRCDVGVMISASHNEYIDIGIKIFCPSGAKLSDEQEIELEKLIDNSDLQLVKSENLGRAKRIDDAGGRYIEYLKSRISSSFRLDGLKIVIDCANGAAYKAAPKLFRSLGAKVFVIGNKPNGFNINKDCGSTFPKKIQNAVIKNKANLGISLDGDADRIIMCDEKGVIIDGDQIIAALALEWKKKKILRGGVIGTLMSNYGLEDFLKKKKIKFIRSKVGDRYVKEMMQKYKFNLGGEQSGHIILGKFATTGDGLLVSLEIVKFLDKKTRASIFFNVFKKTPQILKNINYRNDKILKDKKVLKSIKLAKKLIEGQGRILVRKSGTEPKIRVMGESENKKLLNHCIKLIIKKLN